MTKTDALGRSPTTKPAPFIPSLAAPFTGFVESGRKQGLRIGHMVFFYIRAIAGFPTMLRS